MPNITIMLPPCQDVVADHSLERQPAELDTDNASDFVDNPTLPWFRFGYHHTCTNAYYNPNAYINSGSQSYTKYYYKCDAYKHHS